MARWRVVFLPVDSIRAVVWAVLGLLAQTHYLDYHGSQVEIVMLKVLVLLVVVEVERSLSHTYLRS